MRIFNKQDFVSDVKIIMSWFFWVDLLYLAATEQKSGNSFWFDAQAYIIFLHEI